MEGVEKGIGYPIIPIIAIVKQEEIETGFRDPKISLGMNRQGCKTVVEGWNQGYAKAK